MRHQTTLTAALACAALVLVAGCGDGEATGSPTTTAPTPTSPGPSNFGAPSVKNPLDTSSIDSKPCDVATPDQMKTLPGTIRSTNIEDTASTSKSCAWAFEDDRGDAIGSVRAGVNQEPGANGLQTLYKANKNGTLTVFKELPDVKGFPAVAYEQGGEREGKCAMAVGLRDDQMYSLSIDLWEDHPNRADPCTIGAKIAGFAVEYLQGRQ